MQRRNIIIYVSIMVLCVYVYPGSGKTTLIVNIYVSTMYYGFVCIPRKWENSIDSKYIRKYYGFVCIHRKWENNIDSKYIRK